MPSDERQSRLVASLAVIAVIFAVLLPCKSGAADDNSLWGVYEQALKGAKYVDLTHTITPIRNSRANGNSTIVVRE